jgi:hypothetical protein
MIPTQLMGLVATTMIEILTGSPSSTLVNIDETSWKFVNHHIRTVADTRTKGISCLFDNDPKIGVTVIAIISAEGEKSPFGSCPKVR